ncbi:unnamed protein product [Clavelina lepadiformis]|uniref:Uncharacterized protein n=1 Tax=Clavelina lepadiformis TaxID=159417 RepID=A0ABP0FAN8_CLALP
MKSGVNINAVDNKQRSTLHYASESGQCTVIELLLKEDNIQLNEQDNDGRTPLMLSALNGHFRASRILVLRLAKFDLDVDLRDKKGYTALLLAIRNKYYSIGMDLVKYGNACSTIRDNEVFKNASEWLKEGLNEQKMRMGQFMQTLSSRSQNTNKKNRTGTNNGIPESRLTSAVPLLTLTTMPESDDKDVEAALGIDFSGGDGIASIKEAVAMSGLLFEPDPYRKHSRPVSSALSRVSVASSKNFREVIPNIAAQIPDIAEVLANARSVPEEGSVISIPASQKNKHGDDLPGSVIARDTLLSASSIKKSQRRERNVRTGKGKLSSARKESAKPRKPDLGNINVPMNEFSYPQLRRGSKISQILAESTPAKDSSKNSFACIMALKQALKEQQKKRLTRDSVVLSRPYTSLGASGENHDSLNVPMRPHTRALDSAYKSIPKSLLAESIKSADSGQPRAVFRSSASVNTMISQSELSEEPYTPNHRLASAIERANRNIRTLFSLYTDSYLWTPKPLKPDSLSVQMADDKLTIGSDQSNSVSDLASLVDRSSIAQSDIGSQRSPDSKPTLKTRLMSGSATSRASRRSAGLRSAGSGSTTR